MVGCGGGGGVGLLSTCGLVRGELWRREAMGVGGRATRKGGWFQLDHWLGSTSEHGAVGESRVEGERDRV